MDTLSFDQNAKSMGAAQPVPKARQLTAERLREVLDYNPETGAFKRRIDRPGCKAGQIAGTIANGYRQIEIDYKLFRASRLAWLYMTGQWPRHMVDHINGKRDDDRWCNLRDVTPAQNARNRGVCRRNTSGRVGVHPVKKSGKWGAEIWLDGRNKRLGHFKKKSAAIKARRAAEIRYYGEYARGAV
jgi:hypothetical protein